jgi:hypothetical protein
VSMSVTAASVVVANLLVMMMMITSDTKSETAAAVVTGSHCHSSHSAVAVVFAAGTGSGPRALWFYATPSPRKY